MYVGSSLFKRDSKNNRVRFQNDKADLLYYYKQPVTYQGYFSQFTVSIRDVEDI